MFEYAEKILPKKYKELWNDYCLFLQLGQNHFASDEWSATVKKQQISLLERAIRKDFPLAGTLLYRLQKAFVAENLSLYLLLEPLQAWHWLIAAKMPDTEAQISEIVMRLSAPAARMLMVLNNENPSTYLPMTSLLSAQYLFEALEYKDELLRHIRKPHRFWMRKLTGLVKNAAVLLSVVKSKRLKFRLALELNTIICKIDRAQNNKQSELERLDRIKIFLYSVYQLVTIRRKTTGTKEI